MRLIFNVLQSKDCRDKAEITDVLRWTSSGAESHDNLVFSQLYDSLGHSIVALMYVLCFVYILKLKLSNTILSLRFDFGNFMAFELNGPELWCARVLTFEQGRLNTSCKNKLESSDKAFARYVTYSNCF